MKKIRKQVRKTYSARQLIIWLYRLLMLWMGLADDYRSLIRLADALEV